MLQRFSCYSPVYRSCHWACLLIQVPVSKVMDFCGLLPPCSFVLLHRRGKLCSKNCQDQAALTGPPTWAPVGETWGCFLFWVHKHVLPFAGGWCSNGTVVCFGGVFIAAAEAVQTAILCCTQHCYAKSGSTAGQHSLKHCLSCALTWSSGLPTAMEVCVERRLLSNFRLIFLLVQLIAKKSRSFGP